MGNGVEYDFFSGTGDIARPPDLPAGKPIAVYIGAVYPWLDYELLLDICTLMAAVNFVFIGPVHPGITQWVNRLKQSPNVHFLGFRPYQVIPQYLHHADVGMIPFRKIDLTRTVNPVKLYEYSAAGKPTVATNFSDDLLSYKDKIFIASSTRDFSMALRTALQKGKDPQYISTLQSFASEHDWDTKTSRIIQLMKDQIVFNQAS